MADCIQYDNDYADSINDSINLDIDFVESIIDTDFIDKKIGVWYPIVITASNNQAEYCDLLQKSKETRKDFDKYYSNIYGKDKCQSSDVGFFDILDISDNLVASKSRFFDGDDVENLYNPLDCSYCGSAATAWRLIDDHGNKSPESYTADCCDGACDVRMNENDYMPKIPLLNHHYYTEPCDFAYIVDNPARSGPGLGKEKVISQSDVDGLIFDADNIKFYVDWKLKETISEISYDESTTQHDNKNLHDKSYKKSKIISNTCGNFLLTSVNADTKWPGYDYSWLDDNLNAVPEPESFTKPYGIRGSSIDNIFVGQEKVGSFWKWNYSSGILGWYRKYDVNRQDDPRPISGVDLYIADGDMFFATNAKIESDPPLEEGQETDQQFIKACPSGLKIVQNGSNFRGIIPNESSFMYISANIYDLFYEWYERYQLAGHSLSESRRLAAIMATAPQFENVTTDLLDPALGKKDSADYELNSLEQIKVLSENLQTGTNYDSKRINYVATEKDLFAILEYKYGAYLGIENNSAIKFSNTVSNNFVLDLNFDLVTKSTASPSYSQIIKVGGIELLNASRDSLDLNGITYTPNDSYRLYDVYPRIVDADNFEEGTYCDDCDIYSSFYLTDDGEAACMQDGPQSFCYDTLAFFLNNSQGEEEGTRPLRKISDATIRESRDTFFHPYIDIFAINFKKSMYVSSAMYDIPIGVTHPDSRQCPANATLSLEFDVGVDSMIKLYWSTLKQVQNKQCVSNERFPLDLNNTCTCYPNNAYVPNVSTNISPVLAKYGGYSQADLNSIFGNGVVSAGGTISSCTRSDPLDGSDCVRQGSISIPNYVHSTWELEITNGSANYISVDENIDTTVPPWKLDTSVNYVKYNPRQEWKRFATKVKVENKIENYIFQQSETSLYSKQQKQMPSDSQDQGYKITLTNPFLTGLVGDASFITGISMPEAVNCTNYQSLSGLTDIRGDEVSVVNLTFTSKPDKTLLNFYFDNLDAVNPLGLSLAQFDPNSGLIDGDTTFDPVIGDSVFDYDRELSEPPEDDDNEEPESSSVNIYYDKINHNFETIFRNLTEFDINKKTKIYIKNSQDWYSTSVNGGPGFFEHLGHKFAGRPNIFEYVDNEYNSALYPSVFPSVSKKHKWFDVKEIDGSSYPYLNRASAQPEIGYRKNILMFPGSRYYFQVFPSIINAAFVQAEEAEEDENEEEIIFPVSTLEDLLYGDVRGYYLPDESYENGNTPRTDHDLLLKSNYFIKIGDDTYKLINNKFDESSFLKIESTLDQRLYISYNDAQIDLQDVEDTGYVLNSSSKCKKAVRLTYATSNGTRLSGYYNIIQKELRWKFYDQNGRLTSRSKAVHSKLYTYFVLDKNVTYTNKLTMSFLNKQSSFIVYDSTPGLSNELSEYLSNYTFKTKWGDIIGYDNLILDEFINNKAFLIDILNQPTYKNWFYKYFINYLLKLNGENLFFKAEYEEQDPQTHKLGTVDAMGTILQKYNLVNSLSKQNIVVKDLQNYQNFIPIMDITVDQKVFLGNYSSLKFTSSSLITPYYSSNAEVPGDKFWIKMSQDADATTSYVPEDKYSPTLRIDGPFYELYQTRKQNNYKGVGYRKTFLPSLELIDRLENSSLGDIVSDSISFKDYAVYGDKDIPKCEPQVDEDKRGFCLLDNIGSVYLYSDYKYNTTYGNSVSLTFDGKPYYFSYDCGEYNPVGMPQLVTIKKSRLNNQDTYTSPLADNSTSYLKPFDVVPHVYDSRYQKDVEDYLVSNNSQDDNANEMLFRILYGSNDSINREFFGDSLIQPLSKIDLINYSDPEIKPRDLYDQILFNYDKDANFSNFSFDATIEITGTLDIGFESILNINDQELKMTIENNNNIEVVINFKGKDYKKTLFETASTSYSYISVEAGEEAPSPPDDNTTIEKVKTIKTMPAYNIRPMGRRFRTGPVAIGAAIVFRKGMFIACHDIDPSIIGGRVFNPFAGHPEQQVTEDGIPVSSIPGENNRSYDIGGGKTRNITSYVSRIPVNNLLLGNGDSVTEASGMQADLNLIPGPWRWSERLTVTEAPSQPPAELSYGYCQRQMDCDENGDDDKSIKENFIYKYEIGRTKFDLYGHAYLHTPIEEEEEEEEEEEKEQEEEVSSNICFNSVWNEGRGNCIDYVDRTNASEGTSPYGKFYYEMQQPRLDDSWPWPPQGPLDGINVRGDFAICYEPQEYIDPNLDYIEPECVPFSDDTKWGLGYAIWKPLYGFYGPYGERWTTGILHLQTMDPNTDEFWDFWRENENYREDFQNPYHFSNSICADDGTLTFLDSMNHSPVIIGTSYETSIDSPSIRTAILDQLNNYDYKIAEWLVANGSTARDRGLAMNYGDAGVDYCGYTEGKITVKDIDLYLRTTTEIKEYKPEPGPIININITDSNITVTVQGQTICIDNKIDKCPEIHLPANSTYTINDSGCDKCDSSSLKIKLDNKSTYKTIASTAEHVIASIKGTDLNDAFHGIHFVGFVNQAYHRNPHRYHDIGDGWFDVVCGETPGNPWYSHQNIINMDQMGVFDIKKNIWQEALQNLFNTDDYADTQADSNAGQFGAIDLSSQIPDIARIRRTKRGNTNIPESDILHGVVPDSISEIKFREVNTNYDKYRRTTDLGVETGQGVLTTVEAYVTYEYVRSYTLKDAIKQSRLGVTDGSFVNKAFDLEFPLWYGQSLGIGVSNENILNRPPTRNYVVRAFNFGSDEETCHSFECSYNTDESVFYGGSPCPENDHYCWSISSWNGVR